jgi:hypothetical protein
VRRHRAPKRAVGGNTHRVGQGLAT